MGPLLGPLPGTPKGLNVLLMSKIIHLGSFATNFGDEIIESFNFQKMVPNVVPGSPFSTPPGTTTGPNFFLRWVVFVRADILPPPQKFLLLPQVPIIMVVSPSQIVFAWVARLCRFGPKREITPRNTHFRAYFKDWYLVFGYRYSFFLFYGMKD